MEKMLVTTDLSTNSVAGLCFAIQLSIQWKLELLFVHVNKVMEDEIFPNPGTKAILHHERENLLEELNAFVRSVYRSMQVKPVKYKCVLFYRFGLVNSIIHFAENNRCSYICVCTRGRGIVGKLLGTTAGNLITESKVPVFCIPKNYQIKPVSRLLYASDLVIYEQELKKVVALAKYLNAEVEMLHFSSKETTLQNEEFLRKELQNKFQYKITLHLKKKDANTNLLEDLDQAVAEFSPSLLIMFTVQDRTLFDFLFFSSRSEQYSFRTKVPLLVFNKPLKNQFHNLAETGFQ